MLMPKRVKYRKQFRGSMAGTPSRGTKIAYGEYGLVATEPCWIKSNQIEAARVAMTRYIKRGGKVWIKIFPDKPVTKKPAEVRMGSGKGAACNAQAALQVQDRFQGRSGGRSIMKSTTYLEELKAKSVDELAQELVSAKKELFNLRFQNATNQLQNTARITEVRRNIARIQTVMSSKAE